MNNPGTARKRGAMAALLERLHNPLQLRAFLTVALLLSWYVAFYRPVAEEIDRTAARTERERRRVRVAREVEHLRGQLRKFRDRVPEKTDSNEWVQFFLALVREHPIKLVMLDTDAPKELGAYRAMVVRVDVEGRYRDVNEFLRRVEADRRLLRIDLIRLDPVRNADGVVSAKLVVVGVMG
jgi:Tfp pilus assembly protein PilO